MGLKKFIEKKNYQWKKIQKNMDQYWQYKQLIQKKLEFFDFEKWRFLKPRSFFINCHKVSKNYFKSGEGHYEFFRFFRPILGNDKSQGHNSHWDQLHGTISQKKIDFLTLFLKKESPFAITALQKQQYHQFFKKIHHARVMAS